MAYLKNMLEHSEQNKIGLYENWPKSDDSIENWWIIEFWSG